MRKSTFKKIYLMAAAALFAMGVFAQQVGVTLLPLEGATANQEISLILDVLATCPDSALLNADSVMMHSGVTVDDNTWQHVVDFDKIGANGQKPKLIPFSPGAQVSNITMTPVTVNDPVTVVVWPKWTCPTGALLDADSIMMHSGIEINGQAWQKVVDFDGTGADGKKPKMTKFEFQGRTGWMFNFVPADFYGVEEGDTVTAINCVFNNGTWDAEGKDITHDGECTDFRLQFSNGTPYKYSINYVPNDFYPIDEGQIITAINCVFNNGTWDAKGAAHKEDSEDCEDFIVPLGVTGIFDQKVNHTFKLYPNPVGNVLNLSDLEDVSKVEIFDVTGKLVLTRDVETRQVIINTSELTDGLYIISYHTANGIQTSKFIKD